MIGFSNTFGKIKLFEFLSNISPVNLCSICVQLSAWVLKCEWEREKPFFHSYSNTVRQKERVCTSVYVCVCVCMCVWACVRVCVKEGDRERSSKVLVKCSSNWKVCTELDQEFWSRDGWRILKEVLLQKRISKSLMYIVIANLNGQILYKRI